MSIKNGTWLLTICDQTLPIEAAGTSTSLFPNLGNSVNCIWRQRRKTFSPTIFLNKRQFPTHRVLADHNWRQILMTFPNNWTIKNQSPTCRKLGKSQLLQNSDRRLLEALCSPLIRNIHFILCVCCIFQDSSSCSLQSSDHLEVQLDQNVICIVSFCRFCSNSLPSYVMLMVMVCVCFVRWWKLTWTKFWAKICFNVCRRSWESFSIFLLLNLFLIKGLL